MSQKINDSIVQFLRRQQIRCNLCGSSFDESGLKSHLSREHYADLDQLEREAKVAEAISSAKTLQSAERQAVRGGSSPKRGADQPQPEAHNVEPSPKRLKSPDGSERAEVDEADFPRRPEAKGVLWDANTAAPRHKRTLGRHGSSSTGSPRSASAAFGPEESEQARLAIGHIFRQLDMRQISPEQLVIEVKGIYAALVIVESKCIDVDKDQNAQTSASITPLKKEQWWALVGLHRTLLHEHYDFFLASQHPSASAALRRLASKYAMPARLWRHGIHSFLELLRHRLPESLEHMLSFIYLAYSIMTLLLETIEAFEDTWIECLGDLSRYRMAIEDDNIREREVWTRISKHWYQKASDRAPTTGRLFHHLAILARPDVVQQIFFYVKSLCVAIPFTSARDSIRTIFDPVLSGQNNRLVPFDQAVVMIHAILFTKSQADKFSSVATTYLSLLDGHMLRMSRKWLDTGVHMAIGMSCALLEYGADTSLLLSVVKQASGEDEVAAKLEPSAEFDKTVTLAVETDRRVYTRLGDDNVLPQIYCSLVFIYWLAPHQRAWDHFLARYAWTELTTHLNQLHKSCKTCERMTADDFPLSAPGDSRPLPEELNLRGVLYAEDFFPTDYFASDKRDDEEKYLQTDSMTDDRKDKILWVAHKIAQHSPCFRYDANGHMFSTSLGSHESQTSLTTTDDIELPDADARE